MANSSLYYFCKYILNFSEMEIKPHYNLCQFLQSNLHNDILVLLPRGTFKSSVITVGLTMWELTKDPNLRFIISSYKENQTIGWLGQIKGIAETNMRFQRLYGRWNSDPKGKWQATAITIAGRTKNLASATITATSIKGTEVSQHCDRFIGDDLQTDENVKTREMVDSVERYIESLVPILDPQEISSRPGPRRIIGTRWGYGDVYGRILHSNQVAKKNGLPEPVSTYIKKAYTKTTTFFPKRFSRETLNFMKQTMKMTDYFFSCNPGDAPVLMSDWSEKRIDQIKVGDEVVGWSKTQKYIKRKLQPSKVIAIGSRKAKVVKIRLSSGRIIRCTPDHNWLNNTANLTNRPEYLPAKVGSKLMFLGRAIPINGRTWLGGIFDGEGSSDQTCIRIAQSRKHNPEVCKAIEDELDKLGFAWGCNEKAGVYWLNGGKGDSSGRKGLQIRWDFANITNPVRRSRILSTLWRSDFIQEKDEVISIESDGLDTVYSMQTETGNYVVWGYCSRNCQYLNDPQPEGTEVFPLSDIGFFWYDDSSRTGQRVMAGVVSNLPVVVNHFAIHDPSVGDSSDSDYAATDIVAVDTAWDMYVMEVIRKKYGGDTDAMIQDFFQVHYRYKPFRFGIESVAFQKTLVYGFEKACREKGVWFQIEPLKTDTLMSKDMRIRGFQPFVKSRKVYLRVTPNTDLTLPSTELMFYLVDGQDVLLDEMTKFPVGDTKDCLDALSYSPQLIFPAGEVPTSKPRPETFQAIYEKFNAKRTSLLSIKR